MLSAGSIRTRVIVAFAILLGCLAGLGFVSHARLAALNAIIADVRDNQLPSVLLLGRMNSEARQFRLLEASVALSAAAAPAANHAAALENARTQAEDSFHAYYPLAEPGIERRMADEVWRCWRNYIALHQRFMALDSGKAAQAALYERDMAIAFEQFQADLGPLIQFNVRESDVGTALAESAARSAFDWVLGLIILKALLCMAIGCSMICGVATPIRRMTKAMRKLAAHDTSVEIPGLGRRDEIGAMAAAVHVFRDGLIETERLYAERETARARELEHLRQIADGTFEGIVIHRDGRILSVNAAMCRMVGYPDESALIGRSVLAFMPPDSAAKSLDRIQQHSVDPDELELVHANGTLIPVAVLRRRVEYDGADATLSAVRDLSERKEAEARIRLLAFHDALTGLPNRALLHDRLGQALEVCVRTGQRLAVLYLDLDRFKFVNDLLGHEAGDQLLIEVANRLGSAVRAMDTVARLGGDEFVVVQAMAEHPQQTALLAGRIIAALSAPYTIQEQEVEIGVSVGIAAYPDDGSSVMALLKNGDIAMYRAKASGRGVFKFFAPEMDMQLRARRDMEQELRHAFNRRELVLYFQPLYDCADRKLDGFEALLRWMRPGAGAVSPAEFIPIAEDCGLILPLGRWVLEAACAEATSWAGAWTVAVNLSPVQFQDPGLADVVADVLQRTRLAPGRLELEVTEGVLISNPDQALATLTRLRALGVRIALDDFGTGYSSLSYLRRFPFDKLKIDRSFIEDCDTNGDASGIVAAIVALAHSLHIDVVAEGVERETQLDLLVEHQCRQAQGFLLGRPYPADELWRFMENGRAEATGADAMPAEAAVT